MRKDLKWTRLPDGRGQQLVGTSYSVEWSFKQSAVTDEFVSGKEWAVCRGDENLDWFDTMGEAKRDAERRVRYDERTSMLYRQDARA